MPLARKNSIGVTLYGGAMLAGSYKNKPINVGTNYECKLISRNKNIASQELNFFFFFLF
jgi:hypothetical protein